MLAYAITIIFEIVMATAVSAPEGGICDNIGTTLVNMKTKRNFWRESDTKSLFYACDENGGELDRDTPCIGGYAANCNPVRKRSYRNPLCRVPSGLCKARPT